MAKPISVFGLLLLAVLIALLLSTLRFNSVCEGSFQKSELPLVNPMMGFAPMAESERGDETSLVYIGLLWREIEPQQGNYDWEGLEEKYRLAHWRERNQRYVLRLICDYPGEEAHMDIPDWLYEMTGDGDWYDTDYGKGYAPNYANERFCQAHRELVRALAEYFRAEGHVAFVELGSIGHWGEWHIDQEAGIAPLPRMAVLTRYVQPWLDYFPEVPLLMRRPFSIAAEKGLGLYNDMTGHPEDTARWFSWIEEGGCYEQTGQEDLSAMPDYWMYAPTGGEFTSSIPMDTLLDTELEQTLSLIGQSHTTFLGPKTGYPSTHPEGCEAVQRLLGYRLWVPQWRVDRNLFQCRLRMTWRNEGIAPFYANWPIRVSVLDETGMTGYFLTQNAELQTIMPGEEKTIEIFLPRQAGALLHSGGRLTAAILDPLTNAPGVHLAVQGQEEETTLILYQGEAWNKDE